MKSTSDKIKKRIDSLAHIMRNVSSFYVNLYLLLMAVWFPFFLTWGYRQAGTDKSMLFRYLGLGLLLSVLPCALLYWFCRWKEEGNKRFWGSLSDSDKLILVYLCVIAVSFLCSENQKEAFWGAKGWYIGLMTQLIYIASFFFVSRFLHKNYTIIILFMISSGISYILGILNRFSVYPVKLEGANPGFISTLGNINWFCGYWSVFFPIAVGLFYYRSKLKAKYRILTVFYLALSAAAGAVQGSDSAMLVFVIVTVVLFCMSCNNKECRLAFYETVMIICCACQLLRVVRVIFPEALNYDCVTTDILTGGNVTLFLAIGMLLLWVLVKKSTKDELRLSKIFRAERAAVLSIFSVLFMVFVSLLIKNTLYPGSIGVLSDKSVFTFNAKWGSSRGITWTAGLKVFDDMPLGKKLIGLGPDSFAYGVYKEGSSAIQMVKDAFGNSRLTNAHNEWITVLVNSGILGLFSYMGIFFSKTVRYIKKREVSPFAFACGLSLIGYMSNNLFSFQQVLNGPFIFIVMGLGEAFIRGMKTGS